jgi:hypothetical protein
MELKVELRISQEPLSFTLSVARVIPSTLALPSGISLQVATPNRYMHFCSFRTRHKSNLTHHLDFYHPNDIR